jgi:hypothetical protein
VGDARFDPVTCIGDPAGDGTPPAAVYDRLARAEPPHRRGVRLRIRECPPALWQVRARLEPARAASVQSPVPLRDPSAEVRRRRVARWSLDRRTWATLLDDPDPANRSVADNVFATWGSDRRPRARRRHRARWVRSARWAMAPHPHRVGVRTTLALVATVAYVLMMIAPVR